MICKYLFPYCNEHGGNDFLKWLKILAEVLAFPEIGVSRKTYRSRFLYHMLIWGRYGTMQNSWIPPIAGFIPLVMLVELRDIGEKKKSPQYCRN